MPRKPEGYETACRNPDKPEAVVPSGLNEQVGIRGFADAERSLLKRRA